MYPSYEVITQQYHELAELISGMRSIAEARSLQPSLFVEANGVYLEQFIYQGGQDQDVDYFRIKQFKNLTNIYLWLDKGLGEIISFEITSDHGIPFTPMIEMIDLSKQRLSFWTKIAMAKTAA